jgi:tRNA threonylcarbamoyladenosine biosynthesis protein TsaE
VPEHVTTSEEGTAVVARALASRLVSGDVVLLSGELGAGKTAFVRGLAEGLGIDPREVSSPTFTLLHEYRGGRLRLHHGDLYRLANAEPDDLGLDELLEGDGVVAIEWPDRLTRVPPGALHVAIEHLADDTRRISW